MLLVDTDTLLLVLLKVPSDDGVMVKSRVEGTEIEMEAAEALEAIIRDNNRLERIKQGTKIINKAQGFILHGKLDCGVCTWITPFCN